jgi:putative transposase/transposase-like zinc-binding protein
VLAPSTRAAAGPRRSHWEVADIVRRFGARYGALHRLSRLQQRVLRAIAQCRTAALGGHLEQCDNCGRTRPVYNSCRNRHCPKCQALAQASWRAAQQALLLPIPYFHVVFTLPHALNPLIHANQRRLYNLLFRTVRDTLTTFARDAKYLGAEIGITAVLHTWSQTLTDHIHLHCIVTGGGLSADGRRWCRGKRARFLFPVRAVRTLFRGKFLAHLDHAWSTHQLRFVGCSAVLSQPLEWQRLLAILRGKPWHVYLKAPLAGPAQVLNYLSRYTHRIAISNERIRALDHATVRFSYKDYAASGIRKEMTVEGTEFIRRFLLHVLPTGFMRVRHYGLLANRTRAAKLARCRELLTAALPPHNPSDPPPVTESAVERILRLTGVDVLRCPFCGQGPLRRIERLPPDTS